ncbi:MAG: 50S ribosomal protein L28 [Bdellovibrionaceae bacterium]|nr:50S ribosomal protein L28 [Pseudobdellovibrionaceae bacterium]
MSRCELTGKGPVVKNLVSHSNIKTKSTALPNVQKKRLFSRVLNSMVRLQVATSAIRDMEHMGGFDVFILNQPTKTLSPRAREVQSRIRRKMSSKKKTAAPATSDAPVTEKKAAKKPAAKKATKK